MRGRSGGNGGEKEPGAIGAAGRAPPLDFGAIAQSDAFLLAQNVDRIGKLTFDKEQVVYERLGKACCELVAVSTYLRFGEIDVAIVKRTQDAPPMGWATVVGFRQHGSVVFVGELQGHIGAQVQ